MILLITVMEKENDMETSTDSVYWFIPQSGDCLISEEEKEQLQSTVLSAAESVKEIYKDVIIADAANYSSGVSEFSSERRKSVVGQLGKAGLISAEENTNMQNPEGIEMFYADYNSDLAFRNTVVVQSFEDGTFRYVFNDIEQIELDLPEAARAKG